MGRYIKLAVNILLSAFKYIKNKFLHNHILSLVSIIIFVSVLSFSIFTTRLILHIYSYENERKILTEEIEAIKNVAIISKGCDTIIYAYDTKLPRLNFPDSIRYEGVNVRVLYVKQGDR